MIDCVSQPRGARLLLALMQMRSLVGARQRRLIRSTPRNHVLLLLLLLTIPAHLAVHVQPSPTLLSALSENKIAMPAPARRQVVRVYAGREVVLHGVMHGASTPPCTQHLLSRLQDFPLGHLQFILLFEVSVEGAGRIALVVHDGQQLQRHEREDHALCVDLCFYHRCKERRREDGRSHASPVNLSVPREH